MKYIPLFLFLSISVFGQSKKKPYRIVPANAQTFDLIMEMTAPGDPQMDTIWTGVRNYCRKDKDTCEILLNHVQAITKDLDDKVLYGKALMLAGNYTFRNGEDSLGFATYQSAREIFEEEKDTLSLSKCDSEIGSLRMRVGQFEKAAASLISAINFAKSVNDSASLTAPLARLGSVYFNMNKADKADELYAEALWYAEKYNDFISQTNILVNKSSIVRQKAEQYAILADSAANEKADLYRDSANFLFNKTTDGLEKAMAIAKNVNHYGLIVGVSLMTSILKNQLGEYKEAEEISKFSFDLAEQSSDLKNMMLLKSQLSISQRNRGLFKEALSSTKMVIKYAELINAPREIFEANRSMYHLYKELGMHKEAMEKLEEIIEYIGEDNKKDIKNAITEIEVKYKTAEKEKQILQQKNDILELESTNAKIQKQKNYIMAGGLLFSLLGFFGYRFNKVRKDRNDKKEFAEALIFAQEEERKRIARDLHDGVGQSLLLIKNQLRTTAEVTLENQQMISDTLEEVRSISRDLHPFQLDKFGLTATINDTLLKIEKSTALFITKEIEDIDKVLNPKSEIHLYRTIQEALSNIVKHAQATAAKVSIKNEANQIRVTIQDNGKGFDLELAVVTSKSLGIRTMHERISAIGGTLKIEAGESGGTVLSIVIPKR